MKARRLDLKFAQIINSFRGQGGEKIVAQIFNLLYRRIAFGRAHGGRLAIKSFTRRGLKVSDTAEWNLVHGKDFPVNPERHLSPALSPLRGGEGDEPLWGNSNVSPYLP